MLYWHWLAFGMALMAIEIFLPSFTALWFGAGAILVGILLLLIPSLSLAWQVGIWAVASAAAASKGSSGGARSRSLSTQARVSSSS